MPPRRISTVTTAASQLLTTVRAVEVDLDINEGLETPYIRRLIASASADAAKYCNRTFMLESVTDRFFIPQSVSPLVLSRAPTQTIVSVTVDGVALAADEYLLESETGFLFRLDDASGSMADWSPGLVTVALTGGYSTVPADLEGAVISLIKNRRSARQRDPSVRSERIPDVYDVTYWVRGPGDADLPPDVSGVFDRYREIPV